MNKNDETPSWFDKIKQMVSTTPNNQDELLSLLRDALCRGIITPEILAIFESTLVFSQMRARDVMLPKNQISFINKNDSFNDIVQLVTQSGHSRFPVTEDNLENIIGILHAKDLLNYQNQDPEHFNISDLCRQTPCVPESKRLDTLLREFRHNRNHMAIVVDEYGAISGFITIEDIIEQIVGDIEDEFDIEEEPYIKSHSNNNHIIKAHMPITEFNQCMQTNFSSEIYDTIGGIVMTTFGHLPKRGETITLDDFEFTVLNADARHIKLLECVDKRPKKTYEDSSS